MELTQKLPIKYQKIIIMCTISLNLKKKHVRVRVMPIFVVHILFGVARSSESEYSPGSF